MATSTVERQSAMLTIQVPENLVEVLRPLDGALALTTTDVRDMLHDELMGAAGRIEHLAETYDNPSIDALRSLAARLGALADAFEAVA